MCNLYSMTKPQQAVRDLARVAVENDMTGNLPPLPAIFPDQQAPVVINAPPANTRTMMMTRWGFPQPRPKPGERAKGGYVTNVRNTNSPFWRLQLLRSEFRCLVPVTSFCEPDMRSGKCVWTWFALDESRPVFFFAGIWMGWRGIRGTKAKPEVICTSAHIRSWLAHDRAPSAAIDWDSFCPGHHAGGDGGELQWAACCVSRPSIRILVEMRIPASFNEVFRASD